MAETSSSIQPAIDESWKMRLDAAFQSQSFRQLKQFLLEEKSRKQLIFPPGNLIFNAFNNTPFDALKAVILGQDPYHGPGQAHGLCFSVPEGIPFPPSLKNIFKELQQDLGIPVPATGNLLPWARQGVLLLNATLTVRSGMAGSHQNRGWEQFTDAVIRLISDQCDGIIFLLWGRYAQAKETLIDGNRHHILKAAHPSPLSAYAGFFGCKHFSETNRLLERAGKTPIHWDLNRA